jgi:hypothetical protein
MWNSIVRKIDDQQFAAPLGPAVGAKLVGTSPWLHRLASVPRPAFVVVLLAIAAILVWLWSRHFPLGVHFDEPFKVDSVLRGPSTFNHPLLMIDLVRAANAVIGLTTPQSIVELGRGFAALAGGTLIIATFILGRLVLPNWTACIAATTTLATPLTNVHARYFKEDIFVAPFIVLALAALIVVLKKPALARTVGLGAIIGLAASSKYVGGLLVLPYVLVVIIAFGNSVRLSTRVIDACITALTAGSVFVLIEIPALLQPVGLVSDVRLEAFHAVEGHDVVLPITVTWGTFHLRESLWPGLGPVLAIVGVAGLGVPFLARSERRQPLAVITGFALLWYFAHEISPLKPYPDFARYMVPLAPLLMILSAALLYESVERIRVGAGAVVTAVALLAAAIPSLWLSLLINSGTSNDPRNLLPEIIASVPGPVVADRYAGNYPQLPFLTSRDPFPSAADTTIVVTSSFNYERYQLWGALPEEPERTRLVAQSFARALASPRIDISNGRPMFGFFNPTTTVIAMDGNSKHLVAVAEMVTTTAPSLIVNWQGVPPTPRFLP